MTTGGSMNDQSSTVPEPRRLSLSVVLATYNGAGFLHEQLNSIAAQTLLPDELVISDDGSTDGTLAIVRAFADTAPFPVRILDKPPRFGFADNFLYAAEQVTTDLIAFCDQDDAWMPTKLEKGVARLVGDDSLLSIHQLTMTDEALTPTQLWDQGVVEDRVWAPLELNPWSCWGNTMVFRRELALLVPRAARPRHPEAQRPLSHDTWLYILASALGRVSHIAEPLLLYRQHGANAFGMVLPGWRGRLATMRTVMVESYRERDLFFGALATVFDDIAGRQPDEIADRARRAADRYRERQWRARTRALVYDAPSLIERVASFRRLYTATAHDRIGHGGRVASMAKDALLGVTGWAGRAGSST